MYYFKVKLKKNRNLSRFSFHGKVFNHLHAFLSANDNISIAFDFSPEEMVFFSLDKEALSQFRDFTKDIVSSEGDYIDFVKDFMEDKTEWVGFLFEENERLKKEDLFFSEVKKINMEDCDTFIRFERRRSQQDKLSPSKLKNNILFVLENQGKEFGVLKTKIQKLLKGFLQQIEGWFKLPLSFWDFV